MNRRNRGGWSGAGEGGGGRGAPRTACGHRGQSVVAFASWRPKPPRRGRKLPVGWCGVGGGRCAAVGEEGCWGDGKPFEGGELSGDRSSGCRVVGQTGARHDSRVRDLAWIRWKIALSATVAAAAIGEEENKGCGVAPG